MRSKKAVVVGALLALMPLVGMASAQAAAPPQTQACTVNHYRANHNPTGVWHITEPHWIRDKHPGDHVTGPSSNVMDNLRGDWRVVYLGGGGIARIYRYYLDYLYCT